jgi:HTH-type transcriptional regulator/antitoxin HigA
MNVIDPEVITGHDIIAGVPTVRYLAGRGGHRNTDMQEYQSLLSRTLPHIIRTEAENERYLRILEGLDAQPHPTPAQKALADLLTLLIEDFEERHYALKPATPIEHLQELMAAHDLKQKDLVDIFGTASIVSEVLHGKRQLTTEHIRRLSERFHVSPELFI